MNFLIITNVEHTQLENQFFGYSPYVREMNLWIKNCKKVTIVAPIAKQHPTEIDVNYKHQNIDFIAVKSFNFLNFKNSIKSIFYFPMLFFKIFKAMKSADHIHLRCPGNMGLLGCLVQVFFPSKQKTAKYAGNWDIKSQKPLSYKLQQYILNNTLLTQNMQVLVYGQWPRSSKNIKPFFTATYSQNEIEIIPEKSVKSKIKFIFVGMLVHGKNPLYAILIIENLAKSSIDVSLDFYGDGVLKNELMTYVQQKNLSKTVSFQGNQPKDILKKAYQESHYVILPSVSEGWPKAVAEAMFWGCVPIATVVSCVPDMLNFGERGILLSLNLKNDIQSILKLVKNNIDFLSKSNLAKKWSQQFTTDKFESEIKNLLL